MNKNQNTKLSKLKNIGPTIEKRLNAVGIYTKEELEVVGPAIAYLKIKEMFPLESIPVCYYLYSFEGALIDKHWNDIPEKSKEYLLNKIGK